MENPQGYRFLPRVTAMVTPWTLAAELFCLWDSPGKKTGVDSHRLLQGIFLTQESNPGLLHFKL